MAIDLTKYETTPREYQQSESQSTSKTTQQSTTGKVLDPNLVSQIMGGLAAQMTDEEIAAFAESLLRPVLNAESEAARQQHETTKLSLEQEIENLAASLERAVQEQRSAYVQGAANVENAALARGMGRSSYTLQTLAGMGDALAKSVRQLTDENARQSGQIQKQITQSAAQNAQTQGRLQADYATNLAAKIQELRQNQRNEYNQNYMTAVSGALGSKTDYLSETSANEGGISITGNFKSDEKGAKKKSAAANNTSVVVKQDVRA